MNRAAGRETMEAMAEQHAKRWFVTGKVQGVGFRNFAQQRAMELHLAGWARNAPDGRVEVYAVGAEDQLMELAASLHIGPTFSDVSNVEETAASVEPATGFQVR